MNRLLMRLGVVLAIAMTIANVVVLLGIARNVAASPSDTTITRLDPTGWKPKPVWI